METDYTGQKIVFVVVPLQSNTQNLKERLRGKIFPINFDDIPLYNIIQVRY